MAGYIGKFSTGTIDVGDEFNIPIVTQYIVIVTGISEGSAMAFGNVNFCKIIENNIAGLTIASSQQKLTMTNNSSTIVRYSIVTPGQ